MASGGGPPPPGRPMGRGGRGLAILQALKKEQQAVPGQAPGGPPSASGQGAGRAADMQPQAPQAQQPVASQPPFAQLQPPFAQPQPAVSQPSVSLPSQPPLGGAPFSGRGGRGNLAGMLAMVQQQQSSILGRGMRAQAAATAGAAPQAPGPSDAAGPGPSVPQAAAGMQAGEPAAPVGAMASLAVSEPGPPCEEPTLRKPAVTRRGVPGRTGGEPSKLAVNYIQLTAKNRKIFQYHVTFDPVIDSKSTRIGLLNEHKDLLPVKLFDGAILFVPEKLPQEETQVFSTRRSDGAQISLTIKLTKTLLTEQCPQLYNILLRKIMGILKLRQVGRYYYNPATPSHVPAHKLEVWPGYITAIKEHEGGLMLLLDSSHRVLRCQTVLELMAQIIQERPHSYQEDITRQIVGCTVLTRYNNKTYRVDDIDWGSSPLSSFKNSKGEEITFKDYYREQYGKEIDPEQPLLVHRPKAKVIRGQTIEPRTELICLIPGLCYLTGLTDDLRKNFRVMKDLSAHTRSSPSQRLVTMRKFVDSISKNAEACQLLENWGVVLDDTALAVEGRQMNTETIFFGQGKTTTSSIADWGNFMTRSKVISAVDLERWAIFYTRRNTPDVMSFVQMIQQKAPQLGITVRPPEQVPLQDDKTETLMRALRDTVNPRTQLVCVVMPTSREDKYSAVKKFACVDCPVPSQVVLHKTIRDKGNKLGSVVQKIVLQINCKLGGELWAVKNPLETAMVIGVDSYHDIARGRRSIGGFVASSNQELTRWFSRVRIQMQGEELVPGLRIFMVSAIRKYHETNHQLPAKIIVYRDGVGDGQLPIVQDFEVRQILDSFTDFGKDYHPKLTVVVVQKRINTRIFQQVEGSHLDNPPPGTVLDHTVTRRDQYDYFVVSQHVRQGTVSPTHYIVVYDEVNLSPERMQVFTYKMTHLYYNWPGTVRVPAPCLYAHKLAYLVGESIHRQPSEHLSDRLFFL